MRAERARIEARQESPERPPLALGLPAIDALLGGGLRRAEICEVVGARSSGRMALVGAALQAAEERGERTALLDAADAFLPQSMPWLPLERLLWVRPPTLEAAFKSVDRLLDAGGFGLLVLYLVEVNLRKRGRGRFVVDDPGLWARLQRRVKAADCALLVIGDRPLGGAFSHTVVELAGRPRWDEQGAPLLVEIDSEAVLLRTRHHRAEPPIK